MWSVHRTVVISELEEKLKMQLTQAFPDVHALEVAPVHDVAAVVLEYANSTSSDSSFYRSNLVNALADLYFPSQERRHRAQRVIAEAVAYLFTQNFLADDGGQGIGAAHMITRLGRSVRTRRDFASYAKGSLLPRELLRADLAEIVLPLFLAGHYDDAVSAAFKRIEIDVRRIGKFSNEDFGVALMRKAFGENGALVDAGAPKAEQEALAHLFAGALGYFKNPLSHRDVGIDDARMAASRILFANELLAQVALRVISQQAV